MGRGMWVFVLGILLVAGCGSWTWRHGAATMEEAPQAAVAAPYDWQEEGQFPTPAPVPAEAAGATLNEEVGSADSLLASEGEGRFAALSPDFSVQALPAVEPPPQLAPTAATGTATLPGYRVQVFATRSRDAAERLQGELQQSLTLPTHLDFEDPYFKVRVGDCSSEAECRLLQEQLRNGGWASAFVVPAQIVAP